MRGAFSLFTPAYAENLLLPFEIFFLYINMLSAARRAEVELRGYWLDGSGFEFRYGQKICSPMRLSFCGGYFLEVKRLEGETQNSPPSNATLRMCGAVPPHPLHAFVVYT